MLVTMKELLDRASAENYAVAAPNVSSELDARAFVEAAEELNAPLILDVGYSANPDIFMFGQLLRDLATKSNVPIAINLDHGGAFEDIIAAIQAGFTSVMVDRSATPYETNVKEVSEIVKIAHAVGVTVEAELGHVGQAQSYDVDRDAALTSVDDAKKFIEETGVDCLAVAIGTAHGAYPKGFVPYLDFDRLAEIKKGTNNFPLVLHGSSGTKDEDLQKACSMGINKVNIANDLCQAAAKALKAADLEGQAAYGVYNVAREGAKELLKKMIKIYGSDGKAWNPVNKGLGAKATTMEE